MGLRCTQRRKPIGVSMPGQMPLLVMKAACISLGFCDSQLLHGWMPHRYGLDVVMEMQKKLRGVKRPKL